MARKKGLVSANCATIIGGSSSVLELCLDALATMRERRQGFSSEHAVAFIKGILKHVDELVVERERLMAYPSLSSDRRELLELKGQECKYLRDRLVFEFEQWNIHARQFAWYKNSFYVLNTISNFTRFTAVQLAFKALKNRRYSGAVGPVLIVSGAIATITPGTSFLVGRWMRRHETRLLAAELGERTPVSSEEIEAHPKRLSQLLATGPEQDART